MADASKGITITINAATDEALAKLNQFFGGLTKQLNGLTQASSFLSGLGEKIAAAFTVAALVDQFKKAIDGAEDFGKAVQKTSLSIKALGALKVLGDQNNISFEMLTLSMGMLNEKIFEAVRMGGDLARPFRDLKISLTDANGSMLSTEAILKAIMDKFHDMPDGPQKTAAAMQIFGREARQLIPLLNAGAGALKQMEGAGGGFTPEMIENSTQFHEQLVAVHEAMGQIFIDVSAKILPILQDFAGWLDRCAKSANESSSAVSYLEDVLKVLATACMIVYYALQQLSTYIGGIAATVVRALVVEFKGFKDVLDLVGVSLGQIGLILDDLIHGRFDKAKQDIEALKYQMEFIGLSIKQTFIDVFSSIGTNSFFTWD